MNATRMTLDDSGVDSAQHDLNGLVRPLQELNRQPDDPVEIMLDSTEAGFPLGSSLVFDTETPVNQSWQDMGFMDTFWELPSLVSST